MFYLVGLGLFDEKDISLKGLECLRNADKIYVMKEGKVVETGTYDSLMKEDGYFAQLAKRQNV